MSNQEIINFFGRSSLTISKFLYEKTFFEKNRNDELKRYNKIISDLEKYNIHFLFYNDSKFPINLKEINDPPSRIFFKGNIKYDYNRSISIVGTRNISTYANTKIQSISETLAKNKFTIISGLARGTDEAAHRGAISEHGKTFAVLGSPLNYIYPSDHEKLAEEIINQNGAIISEYCVGEEIQRFNFVRRNRIISALSKVVFIAEGSLISGSLSQYNHAKRQNKIIMTLKPENLNSKNAELPNKIMKDGYHVISSYEEILKILEKNGTKSSQMRIDNV